MNFAKKYLHSLIRIIWIFTIGVVFPRSRSLIHWIAMQTGFQDPKRNLNIRTISIAELLPGEIHPVLLEADSSNGNVTLQELLVLGECVRRYNPNNIFEFGTFDGRTTLNLAANAAPAANIYTLDLPVSMLTKVANKLESGEERFVKKATSGARFQAHVLQSKIEQLYGDSATFDFAKYFGTMDFIFVDASHEYHNVKKDSESAFRLIKENGGVIFWHDYQQDWPGVIKALNEIDNSGVSLVRIQGTSLVVFRSKV